MKKLKMLEQIGDINDKYIDEANTKVRKLKLRPLLAVACIAIVVISLSLYLFLPLNYTEPTVRKYKNDDYSPVIEKLSLLNASQAKYDNNFEKLVDGIAKASRYDMDVVLEAMPEAEAPAGDISNSDKAEKQSYEETTDNQVKNVIEADIFKRSDKYIYYFSRSNLMLTVYSIKGKESEAVAKYDLQKLLPMTQKDADLPDGGEDVEYDLKPGYYYGEEYSYYGDADFFLSEDCTKLFFLRTVFVKRRDANHNGYSSEYTEISTLDVTDPKNITRTNVVRVSGSKVTSRLQNGKLYVVSNYYADYSPDFDKKETYIPVTEENGERSFFPMDNIVCPDNVYTRTYCIVTEFNTHSGKISDSLALLSYTSDVYVSNNSIYISRSYYKESEPDSDGISVNQQVSDITRLSTTGEKLENKGTVTVIGGTNGQYSFDEYNGILRVATSERKERVRHRKSIFEPGVQQIILEEAIKSNASLFCVDIEKMEIVASVERFAPDGEDVKSVRFDGNYAYVCTAIRRTDPVFFFDLTDINDIKVKNTGTIPGFSTSLVNFKDGFLVGIGIDDESNVKIEVYKETETDVTSVCKFTQVGYTSSDYKSYFIDREKGLIGLHIEWFNDKIGQMQSSYFLLQFNGSELNVILKTPFDFYHYDFDSTRAALIDNYLYILTANDFLVEEISVG